MFLLLTLCCYFISDTTTQAKADSKDFWVNMPNLISHLKKVSEQKPQATYYNVDMLKYQVGISLNLYFSEGKTFLHFLNVWAGLNTRPAVEPFEPGGELEVWADQHRPEDRL